MYYSYLLWGVSLCVLIVSFGSFGGLSLLLVVVVLVVRDFLVVAWCSITVWDQRLQNFFLYGPASLGLEHPLSFYSACSLKHTGTNHEVL